MMCDKYEVHIPRNVEASQLHVKLVDSLLEVGDPGGKPPVLALLHQPLSQPVQGVRHTTDTVYAQSLV